MVSIFDADLVKDHFIITDNGKRALIDTGCPFIINDGNKQSKHMGELFLNDARRNVDPTIDEFRGLEYFAQRKVLFDYRKAVGVIGIGLYKNFQVLVDCPNKRLVLGRY